MYEYFPMMVFMVGLCAFSFVVGMWILNYWQQKWQRLQTGIPTHTGHDSPRIRVNGTSLRVYLLSLSSAAHVIAGMRRAGHIPVWWQRQNDHYLYVFNGG